MKRRREMAIETSFFLNSNEGQGFRIWLSRAAFVNLSGQTIFSCGDWPIGLGKRLCERMLAKLRGCYLKIESHHAFVVCRDSDCPFSWPAIQRMANGVLRDLFGQDVRQVARKQRYRRGQGYYSKENNRRFILS